MSPKSRIALSLCWMLLCLLRIGGRWDDLYWFLITIGRKDPRALPPIDPQRVWNASDAIWWFFGLILWGVLLVLTLVRLIKGKAAMPKREGEEDIMPF